MMLDARYAAIAALVMAFVGYGITTQSDEGPAAMKTYDWTSSDSAPADFPIQLVRADLLLADGGTYYVPDDRTVHNGWGSIGATHFVGEDEKALPEKLTVSWYSYIEDVFYGGEFDLPTGALEALFDNGLESPRRGERRDYERVIFGFGPEGEAAVWAAGFGTVVQVMRFQAPQVDLDWKLVLDDPEVPREMFIDMILDEALEQRRADIENRLPLNGYWARRQQRHPLTVAVSGAAKLEMLRLETMNGERLHFDEDGPLVARNKLGIPRNVTLEWTGQGGEERIAEIALNEDEALRAFERLSGEHDDMRLNIQIAQSSNALTLVLTNAELEYEFSRSAIEIFSR